MVQLTLTNVDRAQKNKRNPDTMTLSDSDDERGDKDDEGSLYAESTGDATEAASECANNNTGNKTKTTAAAAAAAAAAAVAKPRKKRSETSLLESPWG